MASEKAIFEQEVKDVEAFQKVSPVPTISVSDTFNPTRRSLAQCT
jgi:hypothetical protein